MYKNCTHRQWQQRVDVGSPDAGTVVLEGHNAVARVQLKAVKQLRIKTQTSRGQLKLLKESAGAN
eukprot:1156607-Pelagomonas_calceolata.AAC.5